ncbi:MAG: hypothetical protein HAW67_05830 [Endozoicomonadaceae bacterium]|nr:hypothetical protein [Endozoicomonadaceae bacterium]
MISDVELLNFLNLILDKQKLNSALEGLSDEAIDGLIQQFCQVRDDRK